jgi:triosephosphate isomerase
MHKDRAEAAALVDALVEGIREDGASVEMIIAPPFPFLDMAVQRTLNTGVHVAAQTCHEADQGAFTGEVSARMLASIGVRYVIIGHSERRQYFGETDAIISEKIAAALKHGLTPIFCCGERKEERVAGAHFDTVTEQMKGALSRFNSTELQKIVVAYEPVWAIGTGLNATAEQAQDMHAHIRSLLNTHGPDVAATVPILYGGSCKPDNAEPLFRGEDVNGGLIGGASLEARSFLELVRIAELVKA